MIRPYHSRNKEELVVLLRLNIPHYFDPAEEADFIEYLDRHLESYFVFEDQGQVIGSGGLNFFPAERTARISWDIVHPDYQGRGIGRQLTQHRINEVKSNPHIDTLIVRTTQLVYGFYEKMGFTLEKTEQDFWAPGFDLYQLRMDLS